KRIVPQTIAIEGDESAERVLAILDDNRSQYVDRVVRYDRGSRLVARLGEMAAAGETPAVPWRSDGVYLITGGGGGLLRGFPPAGWGRGPRAAVGVDRPATVRGRTPPP